MPHKQKAQLHQVRIVCDHSKDNQNQTVLICHGA